VCGVGELCQFVVDTRKAGSAALSVTVDGPSKVHLDCVEVPSGYQFTYRPLTAGQYAVSIKYAGDRHISGSPFIVTIKGSLTIHTDTHIHSVGIDLKEPGGQLAKCLKFCPGIEI